MKLELNQEQIQEYIPHRYENLLIDSIVVDKEKGSTFGDFQIFIQENDSLHRDIFTKKIDSSPKIFMSTIFVEIFALASIVSIDKLPEGYLAFFGSIAHFKKQGNFLLGHPGSGRVKKIKEKANFIKFSGEFFSENQLIASAEILASYLDFSKGIPKTETKPYLLPVFNQSLDISFLNSAKASDMFLVDRIVYFNSENYDCIGEYTFSENHPLCKGHFPGNPIMMGIMQWMMIEDASLFIAYQLNTKGISGHYFLQCDAEITNAAGALVADAKGVKIEIVFHPETQAIHYTDISETQRISFREMVRPGDTLFVLLKNIKI